MLLPHHRPQQTPACQAHPSLSAHPHWALPGCGHFGARPMRAEGRQVGWSQVGPAAPSRRRQMSVGHWGPAHHQNAPRVTDVLGDRGAYVTPTAVYPHVLSKRLLSPHL